MNKRAYVVTLFNPAGDCIGYRVCRYVEVEVARFTTATYPDDRTLCLALADKLRDDINEGTKE